jgi:hypothetical protein
MGDSIQGDGAAQYAQRRVIPIVSGPLPSGHAGSPHLQRLSIEAVEELRKTVRIALTDLFGNFIRQFNDTLTQTAADALNPSEQREYQDLARLLADKSSRWIDSFVERVDLHLTGGVPQQRAVKPAQPQGADDSVALANVELQAETRYQKLVMELDARVNRLRLMLYVPVYTKALAPAGLCRALNDTADALGWPPRQRRRLFENFNQVFIPQLDGLYRSLITAVTRTGAATAKNAAEATQQFEPETLKRAKKSATKMEAPSDQDRVDAETVAMLQAFALKADGDGYTDGLLAADLLALADHRPLPGVAQDQSWVPLQRIALAGHFLNEVIADPMVPDELKPQHEAMRYPLVKSALTDETLFTSPSHPLSNMVNELLLKSATSRVTGNVETRRIAELLQQLLVQFDLAPEFVRQSMHTSQPIQQTQIERFIELQRQQAQQRRDFVISEAKRMVANQLERLTFGCETPPSAIKFLNQAWGPLLTKRLLQHGANHALWNAGVTLMEQLLDQLEDRDPDGPRSAEWDELTRTMVKALIAEGLPQEHLKLAVANLEAARKTAVA